MARIPDETALGARPTPRTAGVVPQSQAAAGFINAGRIQHQTAAMEGQAAESMGRSFVAFGDSVVTAERRISDRRQAIERVRLSTEYQTVAQEELRRLQTEDDLSKPEVMAQYRQFLKDRQADIMGRYEASDENKLRLMERMIPVQTGMADNATQMALKATNAMLSQSFNSSLKTWAAEATDSPSKINEIFLRIDAEIDDMGPALSPAQELQFRNAARQQVTLSAVSGMLDGGEWRQARMMLDETPGIDSVLSPDARRGLEKRISTFRNAEEKGIIEVRRKTAMFRSLLGRDPTPGESLQLAGIDMDATPQMKISQTEQALGRPLTAPERLQVLGLDDGKSQSPIGKLADDRQRLVKLYGANSDAVQSFDDMAKRDAEGDIKLSDERGMRADFTKLSGTFIDSRDSYARVVASAQDPSAAGDLAMIFNYMKVLDPGSTVREGEFATAARAGDFGDRIQVAAQTIFSGKKLSNVQRMDFLKRAGMLFQKQLQKQTQLELTYQQLAKAKKIDPGIIVLDYVNEYRSMLQPAEAPGPTAAPAPTGQPAPAGGGAAIPYGLDGKPMGGGG